MIEAVLWDFGGVITASPFEAFNRFERDHTLPQNFIRRINATNPDTNAWAKLERSEITPEEFDRAFEREARSAGHALRGFTVLKLLYGDLRPEMVEALGRCSGHFRTACLTNNVDMDEWPDGLFPRDRAAAHQEVMELFDLVIESSRVGVRKPEPRFYEIACEMLRITPAKAVYLDDLGINLKPARGMGMYTIKVTEPRPALKELETVLGIPLV